VAIKEHPTPLDQRKKKKRSQGKEEKKASSLLPDQSEKWRKKKNIPWRHDNIDYENNTKGARERR